MGARPGHGAEVSSAGRRAGRACHRPGPSAPRHSAPEPAVAPGLQLGQVAQPTSLQRTAEVRWLGRWAPQGTEGWNLLEAAWLASHGVAVLDATLGGDAPPRQEAAEQAVGLAVGPVRDGAGAQIC